MSPTPTFEGRWLELHEEILQSIGEPTQTDRRLADRMVKNLRAAENAIDLADAEPLVEGSTGQLTEHPGYKIAARCDGVAVSMARQLKLTRFVRERATDEDPEAEETDDPILQARDDLAARRQSRAA